MDLWRNPCVLSYVGTERKKATTFIMKKILRPSIQVATDLSETSILLSLL